LALAINNGWPSCPAWHNAAHYQQKMQNRKMFTLQLIYWSVFGSLFSRTIRFIFCQLHRTQRQTRNAVRCLTTTVNEYMYIHPL